MINDGARWAFEQMSGFAGCKDRNSVFIYANRNYGNIIGLKHHLDASGRTDFDMPCETAACAQIFQRQDREVISSGRPLRILDVHRFADGKWKAFIVTKKPIFDTSSGIVGVFFHGIDIACHTLDPGALIARIHKMEEYDKSTHKGSYVIRDDVPAGHPTKREAEVLFFLIRGKTAKDIANTLGISHRTVEQYITSLRSKFSAQTKAELIEAALSAGFIHYIPESLLARQLSIPI